MTFLFWISVSGLNSLEYPVGFLKIATDVFWMAQALSRFTHGINHISDSDESVPTRAQSGTISRDLDSSQPKGSGASPANRVPEVPAGANSDLQDSLDLECNFITIRQMWV